MIGPEDGAKNSVWAATVDRKDLTPGGFYEPVGKAGVTTRYSTDPALAEELWTWTQEELKEYNI